MSFTEKPLNAFVVPNMVVSPVYSGPFSSDPTAAENSSLGSATGWAKHPPGPAPARHAERVRYLEGLAAPDRVSPDGVDLDGLQLVPVPVAPERRLYPAQAVPACRARMEASAARSA